MNSDWNYNNKNKFKDISVKMRTIVRVTLVWLVIVDMNCKPLSGQDKEQVKNMTRESLSGETLMQIGSKLNQPFLSLIGKTLNELQLDTEQLLTKFDIVQHHEAVLAQDVCLLHPCSEWSQWSTCDASPREQFGGQNRSRNCGFNTTLCVRYSPPRFEYETKVCESDYICPDDYTLTEHGYCVKVYHNVKEKRENAEKTCRSDGGHLVNIDSEVKRYDINQTLSKYRYLDILWIDGKKTMSGGDWEFHFTPQDPDFLLWAATEPNTPADLCKVYDKRASGTNHWFWYDRSCLAAYNFVCQIM